jgi:ABC-type multidrug transport system ATPase subunit
MRHRSVILTSHAMEEVEALCSTVAIMARGAMQAIGSKQHLRHKFGRGFQIVVKSLAGFEDVVRDGMMANIPGLEMGEVHGSVLKFHISKKSLRLAGVFEQIENVKDVLMKTRMNISPCAPAASVIDTYSVSETDLDQIFIELMNRAHAATSTSTSVCDEAEAHSQVVVDGQGVRKVKSKLA